MTQRPAIIYSPRYNLGFPGIANWHPFDVRKFARAVYMLRNRGILRRSEIMRPAWPGDPLLERVHSPSYLRSVRASSTMAAIVEVPMVAKLPPWVARYALLHPMRWAVGGTLLAAGRAFEAGIAVNLGGGFHHARADRGAGFCIFSDIAVSIASLRQQGRAQRFLIVDLDAHQGDGHSTIFTDDDETLIFDMFNAYIFPRDRAAQAGITWEVRLRSGTGDRQYLGQLREALPAAIEAARPDLAFYLAGTDIVSGDPLGLMDVSPGGVFQRDRFVCDQLIGRGIPTVMVTAGGYTRASAQLIATTVEYLLTRQSPPTR